MRLTRRTMLGAFPALGLGAPAFTQQATARFTPVEATDPDYRVDSWVDIYGRPTASVMINGLGPFRFLVDTGTATTVIAARQVEAMGAEPLGEVTVIGATGTAIMPFVELASLQAGVVEKAYLPVAVLPDKSLTREDGILGGDVFAGRRLVFDIARKSVHIEPSKRKLPEGTSANMRIRKGLLAEIAGRVGNIPTRLMLDTGAKSCIANMALNDALLRQYRNLVRLDNARIFGVTGHGVTGQLVSLPKVDMLAFTVQDATCIAADASIFGHWQLNDEPAMIVGVDLLSRLDSFSIDYGIQKFDAKLAVELMARGAIAAA